MQYPLIDRHLLSDLRLVHGAFNSVMMFLFWYQGRLGIMIRRARRAGMPLSFSVIRKHRKAGPVLAGLSLLGYSAGLTLVMLDTGNVLEFPPHLVVGSAIVLAVITVFALSRKIKGPDSPYRNPHFLLGMTLLCLYPLEVFLGIAVLF